MCLQKNYDDDSKTYWSIFKNNVKQQKIPYIPPLLQDYKYVTDFKRKAELFAYLL